MFSVLELACGVFQQQILTQKFQFTNREDLHQKNRDSVKISKKATQDWDLIYGKYQGERTEETSSNRVKTQ